MALRDLEVREIYVKVVSADHARIMARLGAAGPCSPSGSQR